MARKADLRRTKIQSRKAAPLRNRFIPQCEVLEDRLAPAVGANPAAQTYVDILYPLLLNRAATSGAQYWVNQLNSGSSAVSVVEGIESSPEYLNDVVKALYQHYLKRAADTGGLSYWTSQLQGGNTIEQVIDGIVSSSEFYKDAGGTNSGFVTALYTDILGRQPDSGGFTSWLNLLNSGTSTATVAMGFTTSTEYRQDLVAGVGWTSNSPTANPPSSYFQGYYLTYLLRQGDSGGVASWVSALQSGWTDQQVLAGILGSGEAWGDYTTSGSLWFCQNLIDDTALMKEALTLWHQDSKTLQYGDMIKLFQFVANESSNVSATDLSLLQNLISYSYNTAGWMPQSVWNLSSNVVNYNLSNLYYQFTIGSSGNPPAPNLLPNGQLQAGDSSADLLTLVDKWFLGMDHPDMAIQNVNSSGNLSSLTAEGYSNSMYLAASGVLWGPSGPVTQDISQNYLGDCFFLSSLGATVAQDPQAIENMFTLDGSYKQNGQTISIYTVRFYLPNSTGTQFTPEYVTVDTYLPFYYYGGTTVAAGTYPAGYYFEYANGGPSPAGPSSSDFGNYTNMYTGPVQGLTPAYPNPVNHLWVPLLEKAYAEFLSEVPVSMTGLAGYNLPNGANSYYLLDGGEQASQFYSLTGSGTSFTSGQVYQLIGNTSNGYYLVDSVQSNTELTLDNLPGTNFSGSSYNIASLATIASLENSKGKITNEISGTNTNFTSTVAAGDLFGNPTTGYFQVKTVKSDTDLTFTVIPGSGFSSGSIYSVLTSTGTSGAGTISSSGVTVTGTSTDFTSADVGQLIGNTTTGFYEVASVQTTTQLTLTAAPNSSFSSDSYSIVSLPTISSNGATVTGVNTDFTSADVGQLIGNTTCGYYQIASVQSATQLTLSTTPGYNFIGGNIFTITGPGTAGPGTITSTISEYGALSQILGQPSTFLNFPLNDGTLTDAMLQSLLVNQDAVTLSSYDTERSKGSQNVVTGHVYFVTSYTPNQTSYTYEGTTYNLLTAANIYTVINPWGFDNTHQGKAGTLTLPFDNGTNPSLDDFYEDVGYAPL